MMQKIVRTYLDREFRKMLEAELPDFEIVKPMSWMGQLKGVTAKKMMSPKGPSIFVLTNYVPHRDLLYPMVIWSQTTKLPIEDVEWDCDQIIRKGGTQADLLSMKEGFLEDHTRNNRFMQNSCEYIPEKWHYIFLKHPIIKSIIDDAKPASLKNDPTLSYTFTTGFVPELMSDEILKDGYGNIIHELKVWLDSLHAPLKVLESNLRFSSS